MKLRKKKVALKKNGINSVLIVAKQNPVWMKSARKVEKLLAERVRDILKDPLYERKMDPLTSLYLFNAARRQFITEIVVPSLAKNKMVIADRFLLSTIAFQGYAEGVPIDFVREVCLKTVQGHMPQRTFLLDISIKEMKKRLAERTLIGGDRYDQMDVSFHEKVRQGYLAEWKKDNTHIELINGERKPEEITQDILQKILPLIS